jgi:hypothetical protein
MDSSSSTRFPAPSTTTSPSDILQNEIAEHVCQFLNLGDIGRLMQVDSARYKSIRERITDIGIQAIDRDLYKGNIKDAFQRIHELTSWLGGCHFVGPEENEMRVWPSLLQRIPDARFEPKQQSQLLRNLMISAWQRIDTNDFPSDALTDVLLDIFVQAEKANGQLAKEFSLKFGDLKSGTFTEIHVEKMIEYASIEASGQLPPLFDCFSSRFAGVAILRMKVNFLSTSLPDRLRAYQRNLTEIEKSHPLLPRETLEQLVWNVFEIFMTFDTHTQSALTENTDKILTATSISSHDFRARVLLKILERGPDAVDSLENFSIIDQAIDALEGEENSSCSLM